MTKEEKKEYDRKRYLEKREEVLERVKKYCRNNPEKTKDMKLKSAYGITIEQYNQMYKEQEGRCKICGVHQAECKKAFAVDHNHDTGEVRGLLCMECNTGIGKLGDNVELLKKAIEYLKKYESD